MFTKIASAINTFIDAVSDFFETYKNIALKALLAFTCLFGLGWAGYAVYLGCYEALWVILFIGLALWNMTTSDTVAYKRLEGGVRWKHHLIAEAAKKQTSAKS